MVSVNARLVLADGDARFVSNAREWLGQEGFDCECAPTADAALHLLTECECDLLVTDVQMRGNEHLELVREVAQRLPGLPTIVATASPSTDTAIAAIELPVTSYLLKPVEPARLVDAVRAGLSHARVRNVVRQARQQFQQWQQHLAVVDSLLENPRAGDGELLATAFVETTLREMTMGLADIRHLVSSLALGQPVDRAACHLFDCGRVNRVVGALREAVDVLEKTKGSFKSTELRDLRLSLEQTLDRLSVAPAMA